MSDLNPSMRAQASEAILDLVLHVPPSQQTTQINPVERSQELARAAARKATVLAGSMALPPGFLGWLTVLPELVGVWKIQAQMVADIAALHGKAHSLGRDQMLYCLFKHLSAQLFRDVAVRVGERVVVRELSLKMLKTVAQSLGVKVAQKAINKGAARFVPLLGAIGVGAYAYYDTLQVAKTALALFADDQIIDVEAVLHSTTAQ